MSAVEVQKSLVAALALDGIAASDVLRQLADGGATQAAPLVAIGDVTMTPFDTATETGFNFLARIHVRHRSGSMKAVKDVQDVIYNRLHRGTVSVTGFQTVQVLHELSFCDQVHDGEFHGVSEFRGLITK